MVSDTTIGTDIVEVSRVRELAEKNPEGISRHVFTEAEVSWCKERAAPHIHLAGRFAAKEAVKKALLASGEERIPLSGIEILREDDRPPTVSLNLDLKRHYVCQVSISHTDSLATAVAMVTPQ